jgi:hypothetical protein
MTHLSKTQQASTSNGYQILSDIRAIEISFEEHEIYAGDKAIAKRCRLRLIAKIVRDDGDFVTQPWLVMVNGVEIYQANTWAKCYHYVTWHFKQGTLPEQKEEAVTVDWQRTALPVFVSKQRQKSRQVAFASYLFRSMYFKCFEALKNTTQYLLLLFKRESKSGKDDCLKT